MLRMMRKRLGSWTVMGRIFRATGLYFFLVAAKIESGDRKRGVEVGPAGVESAKILSGVEVELENDGKGACVGVLRREIRCEGA